MSSTLWTGIGHRPHCLQDPMPLKFHCVPPGLTDTHQEPTSSVQLIQDSHTLSPRVFSPQGRPTVDQGDSPADVVVRGQLTDPWVLVEPLHSLLEADRRGQWAKQMTRPAEPRSHVWHPACHLKQILLPGISDRSFLNFQSPTPSAGD